MLLESKQWGGFYGISNGSIVALPISATPIIVLVVDIDTANNSLIFSTVNYAKGSFRAYGNRVNQVNNLIWGNWIAVCK